MKHFFLLTGLMFFSPCAMLSCKSRSTVTSQGKLYTSEQQEQDFQLFKGKFDAFIKAVKDKGNPSLIQTTRDALMEFSLYLSNEDKLFIILEKLLHRADLIPGLPETIQNLSKKKKTEIARQIADALDAQFTMQGKGGYLPMANVNYSSWDDLTNEFQSRLPFKSRSGAAPGTTQFTQDLQDLLNQDFAMASRAELLVDGPDSFRRKYQLFNTATHSIWISSWAFRGDETGQRTARLLVKKAQEENVDVRVIVDGQTTTRQYKEAIQIIIDENKGIKPEKQVKIVRWRHPDFPYFGNHRKFLIVDQKKLILGGMNFGDEYSHRFNPKKNEAEQKTEDRNSWRDTDIYLEGRIVDQAILLFQSIWNESQDNFHRLRGFKPKPLVPEDESLFPKIEGDLSPNLLSKNGVAWMMILDHDPTKNKPEKKEVDRIYLLTLKLILSARSTIDISNAYYIATKPMEMALIQAIKNGVKVRLHTNSAESVDVAQLIKPIYRGLRELFQADSRATLSPSIFLQKKRTPDFDTLKKNSI